MSKMAGVAGLEPVTSAVTGQRSNQLSYTPARGMVNLKDVFRSVKEFRSIRAADAKEVGVGNPAEETYCHPNEIMLRFCDPLSTVIVHWRTYLWRKRFPGLIQLNSSLNPGVIGLEDAKNQLV